MANKVEDLVNVILDSYNECDITARIDDENMLNKDILIEIIDELRNVLFPGFFDNKKVRSEYLNTDIQAAYDGDPAAYSLSLIHICV